MTFITHQSHIKCWRSCRRRYWYQYILCLTKRKPPSPLLRGTTIHAMIEERIEGRDPQKPLDALRKEYGKLFLEEREEYGDLPGDIATVMENYFEWYDKDPLFPMPLKKGGPKSEHKFQVNLTPSIILEGRVDMFATDKRKKVWLVDHKTVKNMPKGDLRYSDLQSCLYAWAFRDRLKFYGMCWNYLKFKVPRIPEPLKNGSLSKAKNIDTTWKTYLQAILDNGLDPDDYKDMEEILEGKEEDFFKRNYMPLSPVIIENIVEEAQITAREMKRKGGKDKTRTIDRHCEWCQYYNLCQAELRGLDADFIRAHDYKEKIHENKVGDEEDE